MKCDQCWSLSDSSRRCEEPRSRCIGQYRDEKRACSMFYDKEKAQARWRAGMARRP